MMPSTQHTCLLLICMLNIWNAYAYTVNVNTNQSLNKELWNVWKSEISWYFQGDWMNTSVPSNTIKSHYPFLERVELFTATGGCYKGYPGCTVDRDLLSDPSNPNSTYNFTDIVIAVSNILKQNLTLAKAR